MDITVLDSRPTWRKVLDDRGIALTAFATAIGTPLWTVYSYTRGQRQPSPEWEIKAERVAREMPNR